MIKVSIIKNYKSLKSLSQPFELPDFCILTGKNGSGKSHLMEAMTNPEISQIFSSSSIATSIRYVPFNGLNPKIESDCQYLGLTNKRKQEWNQILSIKNEYINRISRLQNLSEKQIMHKISGNEKSKKLFFRLLKLADNNVNDITEDLFEKNFDISITDADDVFASSFAAIFKLYYTRMDDNRYHDFLNKEYGKSYAVFSEDEFEKKYGPRPWELINTMLSNARLPYQVNNPEGQSRESDFHLFLTDKSKNIQIQVNDLSTGEKVLMSLALAIYNVSESETKPDILLLDEPDASLHPEYSKVLINAIRESIVQAAGVKTIITTHNPTTVALANESEIYQMDKELGYPVKITKENALNFLTKDLDNLRVTVEKRRQVFVESSNDVSYYEKVFRLLDTEFSTRPVFLAPHSRDGANCEDVINIVNQLRSLGNNLVYGLIDFDNKNKDSAYVYVLGTNRRYAIDNYIFDPIFVAFLLIREGIIKTVEIGIGTYSFSNLRSIHNNELQSLIDYILVQLDLFSSNKVICQTHKGQEYQLSKEYLEINGHDLEKRIMNKWPALNKVKGGKQQENIMKNFVLDRVISEYPEFLSIDFVNTLNKIV